jgi:phosphatidylserine decarboxylase
VKHREIIALEGFPFILFFLILAIISSLFHWLIAALILLILFLFCLFFFRNPERTIAQEDNLIISPADGRIMDVGVVSEDRFLNQDMIRVRIFLNLFNVHINRMPISAAIKRVEREGGIFLPANHDEAGKKNVRNYLLLNNKWGPVVVVQITGLVARRLVCWVKAGDTLARGERFGLIRFGSCTELYLPVNTNILVKPGDRVKGGETTIGQFN